MRKIANEAYDFYPLPQMYLQLDARNIRIKDGEIAKEWSRNVTYFKFSGEGLNLQEHSVIQHFITTELVKGGCAFIAGILEEDGNSYHIIVKHKNTAGKKFDFDKVKLRTLRNALAA